MTKISAALFIMVLLGLEACGPSEVFLTRDEILQADSIFLLQREEWSKRLEDSCIKRNDMLLPRLVDSFKNERLAEINLMIKRHQDEVQ